jgi:hypothetical protein
LKLFGIKEQIDIHHQNGGTQQEEGGNTLQEVEQREIVAACDNITDIPLILDRRIYTRYLLALISKLEIGSNNIYR